jgi:hypothetical protein
MKIINVDFDIDKLSEDERYFLRKALDKIINPNSSIKRLNEELKIKAGYEYNEFLKREGPKGIY